MFLLPLLLLLPQIQVGPRDSLQAALDGAPPDAVLLLIGEHEPAIISRPVTLIGAGEAVVRCGTRDSSTYVPALELKGSGSGTVVLVGLELGGGLADGSRVGFIASPLSGGGFKTLVLIDCAVRAPDVVGADSTTLGLTAIDVSVGELVLERSSAFATSVVARDYFTNGPNGATAVRALDAAVLLLDSEVRGGDVGQLQHLFAYCDGGAQEGGVGGLGLEARSLELANSVVAGGQGGVWSDPFGFACGQSAAGRPWSGAAAVSLPGVLEFIGPIRAGREVEVRVGGPAVVFASIGLPTRSETAWGTIRLSGQIVNLGVRDGTFRAQLPFSSALIGSTLGLQALDPLTGLGRPVFANLRPTPNSLP